MVLKKVFYILFLFDLFFFYGQKKIIPAPYYNFDIYTIRDGLSNNRVNRILQDKQGYLWIATENGLNKFDGYKFIKFFHDNTDSLSLAGNTVYDLALNNTGNICVASDGGLDIYNPVTNGFDHVFPLQSDNKLSYKKKTVMAVYPENDSIIWFDTADGLLHKYNTNTKKHKTFQHEKPVQVRTYFYHQIFDDGEGNLWIGGRSIYPVKFVKKDEKFISYKAGKKYDDVTRYYIDKEGTFWIAATEGLYRFDRKTGTFSMVMRNSTYDMIDFNDNEFWFANARGFKILNRTTGNVYAVYHSEGNDQSLPSEYVFNFFKDRSGNMWIGTLEGLCKYSPYKNKFGHIIHIPDDNLTLSAKYVTTIIQSHDEKIWVGTNSHGIDIMNENFIRIVHYGRTNKSKYPLASNHVSKLYQDSKDNVYIGLWAGIGFDFIEHKTDKFYHFRLDPKSLKYDWYNDFIEYKNGNVLLGTWGSYSVGLFDPEKKTFVNFPDHPGPFIKKLGTHFVSCLNQDETGNIYIGTTNKGLSIYNMETEALKRFPGSSHDSIALWGQDISCIFIDSKKQIWIGAKGLNKYDPNTDTFEHYTRENGLCDDGVQAILEDDDGFLWIATLNGLSKFDVKTGTFQNFFEKDGLSSDEFTKGACKLDDGRLLFATKNGLTVFDKNKFVIDRYKPRVFVTDFTIFTEPQSLDLLKTGIIDLKYNRNYLNFRFGADDYSSVKDNRFAYQLENFDEEWHELDKGQKEATYTYLEPGEYTLKVKAGNMDGVWGDTIKKIHIIINPPWWKTKWFMGLEILFLVALVFFIIKFRENKLKEQYFVELLEQRLLRSQMNPHFIFNALGAIQSYLFTHSPLEAGSYLSRFADLMRSILYSSREEFISLEKEIEAIENYLAIQQIRFENKFDFNIEVDPDINTSFTAIPPLLIQPVLENSIEHGFKNLNRKGMIRIVIKKRGDKLKIIVEDNGTGIIESKMKYLGKTAEKNIKHKSVAIQIIKKRLQILNKDKKGKFDLKIENIVENGHTAGVTVTFYIPVIHLSR